MKSSDRWKVVGGGWRNRMPATIESLIRLVVCLAEHHLAENCQLHIHTQELMPLQSRVTGHRFRLSPTTQQRLKSIRAESIHGNFRLLTAKICLKSHELLSLME